jgi:DNA polymerase-1
VKREDSPIARLIISAALDITKRTKMRSIYEGITPASDGAVHSFLNPAGTETSRFSHSSTWLFAPGSYNLATLPKKTAMADPLFRVRDVIVPHEGRVLMAADYSRAEARWCAYIAGDEDRIKLQESGVDEYNVFAALVEWDDESRWEEVPKLWRNSFGKVGVLSGQFKVGWRTLQSSVNDDYDLHGVTIDAKKAKKMEAIWPERFPRTVAYWDEVREDVLTRGFTTNPFGRRRYYFSRLETESQRAAVVREAIADGPQSANAMALNKALRRLHEKHDPELLRLLLQVHDEIVFDCLEEDVERVARIVRDEMEVPFEVGGRTLIIPAEVSVTRTSWSEMEDVT